MVMLCMTNNVTMLYASKAFDEMIHGKLFTNSIDQRSPASTVPTTAYSVSLVQYS